MRVLGLVPARGGSKGFPGKNLALLAGRPLVAWAHRALAGLRARHPELVLHLSTDSAEIAAAWPEADRPRRLRPAELARDDSSTMVVVEHELAAMAAEGRPCAAVLLLQPTSPLVATDDLERLWQAFAAGASAVIGVTPAAHPAQWSLLRGVDGLLTAALPEAATARRQDQRPTVLPMGVYLASTEFLKEHHQFLVPGLTRGVVVPTSHAVDIDTARDLELARELTLSDHGERVFQLGRRQVGGGAPCLVIAEAGVNHNGDPALALELVRAAAEAGADAVKFQTFRAADLVTEQARKAAYQAANTGADGSQLEMLRQLELPEADLHRLKDEAERLGLVFLSSPFDDASADLLAGLGVEGFKLGSGEITNLPFLARLAGLGRPLIISTGMATLDEVEDAAATVRAHGDPPVAWLHCVSSYPAPVAESNLRAMDSLRLALGGPVGMSDHSDGWTVALAAVARGAQVIEKHLTLDRSMPGPDHAASLEPDAFARMVIQIREVESALGDGVKAPADCERDTAAVARRSLVAARDLAAGTVLTARDLAAKRPAGGISPACIDQVAGRLLAKPLAADELLTWEHLAGPSGGAKP
jgi:N-acetylneuraminate synthase